MDQPRNPRKKLALVQLLPNFVTVGALCAGLTAIRFATEGSFGIAVTLIIAAAVMDGLDGRIARLLKSTSEIGAELDSLCDLVNFGVAPAIVMYLWALQDMQSEGWIAALIYVVACLLRLARFNIGNRAPDNDGSTFQGVPSPAGAMLCLLPIFLDNTFSVDLPFAPIFIAFWIAFVGSLMVGRFRTPSFKRVTVYAENVSFVLLGFAVLVAALLTYPWLTLALADLAYLGMLAFGVWSTRFKAKAPPKLPPLV